MQEEMGYLRITVKREKPELLSGHPASSSIWRQAALGLLTFCLMLLIGLVTLGIMFINTKEELKSQISNLLKRQRQMAVKLCQELIIHTSEHRDHKCKPCPKTWHWHRNSCYYFATNEEKTWPNSRKSCMDKNSTLVKIASQNILRLLFSK
uniref:C-type lectin domain family 12 member B n=1 Tax=Sus scrofa TaxID=9823 RepID=A0A8D1CG04_PIG